MGALALIEVLASDGSVRQSLKVASWPLRVGRAIDNDLVLDDPHIGAHHFAVDAREGGVFVAVGNTVNGLQVAGRDLRSGQSWPVGVLEPAHLTVGRVHLRLRLPEHPLPAEEPMAAAQALTHGAGSLMLLGALVLAMFAFSTFLDADPDKLGRVMGESFLGVAGVGLVWCAVWTLLSKVFAQRGHFFWHVRVLLIALLVEQGLEFLASLVAFSFSAPWVSDIEFLAAVTVLAGAFYFHLQAVEPHRLVLTRTLAGGALAIGLVLSIWGNWKSSGRFGSEVYMSHLFPPVLRVAEPMELDAFMQGLAPLQSGLDASAREEEVGETPSK